MLPCQQGASRHGERRRGQALDCPGPPGCPRSSGRRLPHSDPGPGGTVCWGCLSQRPLPALTAPFRVVSGGIALLAQAVRPTAEAQAATTTRATPAWMFGQAVATGISQVVVVASWIGGPLILAELFVAGWRIGLAAVIA